MKDLRDTPPWVVIELTPLGESKVQSGNFADTVKRDLKHDKDVFVPVRIHVRGRRSVSVTLMQGYIFIESGLDEVAYFALDKYAWCERVISTKGIHGMRVLQTVPAREVQIMRKKLAAMVSSDLELGQKVTATGGSYKGLTGTVQHLCRSKAQVQFALRSMQVIKDIPRILLEPAELS